MVLSRKKDLDFLEEMKVKLEATREGIEVCEMLSDWIQEFETRPLSGAERIAEERFSQIHVHNRTPLSDFQLNNRGELLNACEQLIRVEPNAVLMPSHWDDESKVKMIGKPMIKRLEIAGALIAAEIDRLELVDKAVKALGETHKS